VGASVIVPRRAAEGWRDRHGRRLAVNLAMRAEGEAFAAKYGGTLSVQNNGHHWIFTFPAHPQITRRRDLFRDWGEWWPSSAKLIINKRWRDGYHCHDIRQVQSVLIRQLKLGGPT
jgi:hypothetical protein